MQKIIEKLKERGIVDNLQFCVNAGAKVIGSERHEKAKSAACKAILVDTVLGLDEDDELFEGFLEFAIDMAAEAIIKELDLKADENYEPTTTDKLAMVAAVLDLLKNVKSEEK